VAALAKLADLPPGHPACPAWRAGILRRSTVSTGKNEFRALAALSVTERTSREPLTVTTGCEMEPNVGQTPGPAAQQSQACRPHLHKDRPVSLPGSL